MSRKLSREVREVRTASFEQTGCAPLVAYYWCLGRSLRIWPIGEKCLKRHFLTGL